MGYYLSTDDVQDRMDRTVATLYDDDGVVNTIWITDDISAVEGLMHAYLSVRYITPISSELDQDFLRAVALDLFMEQAYRRLPSAEVPPALQAAAGVARDLLLRISQGEAVLSDETEEEAEQAAEDEAEAEAEKRATGIISIGNAPQMSRDKLRGF